MRWGLASGALWGLDTSILGLALLLIPFLGTQQASLVSASLHDSICALILLLYMGVRGRLRDTLTAVRTRSGKAVMLGALLGGPFGMSGYLIAINHIGPGFTAIISTFYPALGTFFAFLFLKERMRVRQLVALVIAMSAIVVIGYSSTQAIEGRNPTIGVLAALACVLGWGSEAVILAWGMRNQVVDNETALHIRQTTSALVYLFVVTPLFGVFGFAIRTTVSFATVVIACAGIAGTASYLFYYRAIRAVGAARGMAANISYSAWAVIFTFFIEGTKPSSVQIICCAVILSGTVLAATPKWHELIPLHARP